MRPLGWLSCKCSAFMNGLTILYSNESIDLWFSQGNLILKSSSLVCLLLLAVCWSLSCSDAQEALVRCWCNARWPLHLQHWESSTPPFFINYLAGSLVLKQHKIDGGTENIMRALQKPMMSAAFVHRRTESSALPPSHLCFCLEGEWIWGEAGVPSWHTNFWRKNFVSIFKKHDS